MDTPAPLKDLVVVSPEMTALVGRGAVRAAPLPDDPVVFVMSGFDAGDSPAVAYLGKAPLSGMDDSALVFVVARAACRRLFPSWTPEIGAWHMTSALRDVAVTILACEATGEARTALRLARSIELLCRLHAALAQGALVPASGGDLNEMDGARIAAARRLLDDSWREKLTIPEIARRCGINRDKLVRGFRETFGQTIAEALSERRLGEARTLLLTSDLPVSSVGYRCGYLNNAAFTRAFARRFGLAPSALRRMGIAA